MHMHTHMYGALGSVYSSGFLCFYGSVLQVLRRKKILHTHSNNQWSIFKTHGNAGLVWRLLRDPIAFSEPLYYH
jgi:hypothetical protein